MAEMAEEENRRFTGEIIQKLDEVSNILKSHGIGKNVIFSINVSSDGYISCSSFSNDVEEEPIAIDFFRMRRRGDIMEKKDGEWEVR